MTATAEQEHTPEQVARVTRLVDELMATHDPEGDRTEFLGAQFDLGLAWVHFPVGHGGLALPIQLQDTIDTHLEAATAPRPSILQILGLGMGAPVLVAHGSEEQKQRFLRPIFTGEEIWCQLFSEPGAGSDLAGLAARAGRDGDEWIINGQKVWTSYAHLAKWGMLVVRTDPDLPKHQGLTYGPRSPDRSGGRHPNARA